MGLLGSVLVCLGPFGSVWVRLGPFGSIWVRLFPIGSVWVHLGSVLVCLGPFGYVWVRFKVALRHFIFENSAHVQYGLPSTRARANYCLLHVKLIIKFTSVYVDKKNVNKLSLLGFGVGDPD